jgi:uncharacterized small protein (DUF1192 family)
MDVNIQEVLAIVGEQTVQITLLQRQIAQLQAQLKDAAHGK